VILQDFSNNKYIYPKNNLKNNSQNINISKNINTNQTYPVSFEGYIYVRRKNTPFFPETLTKLYPDKEINFQIKETHNRFYTTQHAEERMKERNVSVKDIQDTITCGQIYEDRKNPGQIDYSYKQPDKNRTLLIPTYKSTVITVIPKDQDYMRHNTRRYNRITNLEEARNNRFEKTG